MEIAENKTRKWSGIYRGVNFEINNWQNKWDGKENWTYYLILFLDRIPEENNPKSYWLRGRKNYGHILYDYYEHPVIGNISFHGGCTWYSKERGFDGDEKVIKIGCDYSHLWDEGRYYNLNIVISDLRNTIDKFLEFVPDYKYWCCGNGKLYNLIDGIVKDGNFYSREYFGKTMKEFQQK